MWDFVMDKSGAGAGFLGELRFPVNLHSICFSTIIFTITCLDVNAYFNLSFGQLQAYVPKL
jgi:hypothetical protein